MKRPVRQQALDDGQQFSLLDWPTSLRKEDAADVSVAVAEQPAGAAAEPAPMASEGPPAGTLEAGEIPADLRPAEGEGEFEILSVDEQTETDPDAQPPVEVDDEESLLAAAEQADLERDGQFKLLDLPPDWRKEWAGMPAFGQQNMRPQWQLKVSCQSAEDYRNLLRLIGYPAHYQQRWAWFPPKQATRQSDLVGSVPAQLGVVPNQYPVYIISKGRWQRPLTARALERLGIPYSIVVEPQEVEDYARLIAREKILTLPFANLGQGSIPARNWVWEHSIEQGAERHWILDDNIDGFYRLRFNQKIRVTDENPFVDVELWVQRYTNVALAGLQYDFFAPKIARSKGVLLNTRIYSCILIKNDIPYRWRGRYNEDTDLSLRALKDGWCTALFYHYLAKKIQTMKMAGGNTAELYKDDGRLKMAQSLVDQHPDVVRISTKWGRPQHHVDYSPFRRNKLILVDGQAADGGIVAEPEGGAASNGGSGDERLAADES